MFRHYKNTFLGIHWERARRDDEWNSYGNYILQKGRLKGTQWHAHKEINVFSLLKYNRFNH
jgi:hypothetical protein